jgi:AcrR family transcriptional regulator
MTLRKPTPRTPASPAEAGARERLLEGATRVFSRLGYEAATTRMIADEAGVNLASIPYYFGTKEALYAEVIEGISALITRRTAARIAEVRHVLELDSTPEVCLDALCSLVDAHMGLAMAKDTVLAAPILAREEANPSPVFARLFAQVFRPQLDLAAALLARILGQPEDSPEVRVKACVLLGMSVHLGYARPSLAYYLGDALLEPQTQSQIQGWVRELVRQAAQPIQN